MSKKELKFADAERMFVRENCTCNEIAEALNISEKTVRLWKAEGQWDVQRENNNRSRRLFHEELYEFGRAVMSSIMADMKAGKSISDARFNTVCRICPQLLSVKEYEDLVKKAASASLPATREELIALADQRLRGEGDENGAQK